MVVEQAASATPIETRIAPDGVGYSWAEFETVVVAAPEPTLILISPRFELGSIARFLADTTPGVYPMHAEGILVAKIFDFVDDR